MNSGIISFLPMILVFVVFYFVLIRPQQSKQRELRAQLNALRRGDRIKTSGGLIGTVQLAREGSSEVDVEIAPGVKVQVARDSIASVLSSSGKAPADTGKQ
ncbi:preprotein translocase subunit YajC [Acidomonas methanolica]|uniref:Sec translocon accessory complex subunit YajC n=1 Tax=Acidomonas methanolica NBRC 104435 TaxID=1231351 RepID=A0A023D923_ACIMT|nr:preprotein translocase subunit YajC [Acidomonas methanolica]MBU2653869.1 preprotein translocase subunit YajC [Acidomonas methanolica]MCQ9155376.1 preprotein translocase subunit YajC [Acidomonas methanolica]TCS30829.1 preprotein translocase subunit YajC [Acidomonas methanolica]GAJ30639.1 protein translocase subunit YajC [Acidomonas methanolica NBRC 104435]GBQ51572.1 protein translocase subunit YajC [Acidomonas methanolica]